MNFVGTGKTVTWADMESEARESGLHPAAVKAVIAVESSGRGFDARNRPKALFEYHKFYKLLKRHAPGKLAAAQAAGLAFPNWDRKRYPKTSDGVYEHIARACAIDEELALRATSWGLGQVLGENYAMCKFKSAKAMVEYCLRGEREQLDVMFAFIQAAGLLDELQRLDWTGFACGYNGTQYKLNAYDVKLDKAYKAALAAGR